MSRILLLLSAIGPVLLGCAPETVDLTDSERAQIVDQITGLHESLRTAWINGDASTQGDIHRAGGYVTYDARRFGSDAFIGWTEKTGLDGPKQQVGPLKDLQIDILSRESAASSFEFNFAFLDSLGAPGKEMVGLMTLVWTLEDDGWRVLHLHESTFDAEPEGE